MVGVPKTDPGTHARNAAVQSTDDEKIAAAALLGVNPGPELMILSDRDFTVAMYRIADDQDKPRPLEPGNRTVKNAALKALDEGDAACTAFIKTGMKVAHDEDIALDREWRGQQEAERAAKAIAAGMLSIPVSGTDLSKSVSDFIAFLDLNAHAHKDMLVKEKAKQALRGTPDEQWTFLTSGLGAAHTADVKRITDENTAIGEAERQAAKARAAKANAAWQALGVVADDRLVNLPDRSFVFEISNRAPQDTEVFGAAEEALYGEAAEWKHFIDVGAEAAHLRDVENTLKKRDEARKRQILEIRTRAANSLAHPALVAAADKALAGTPADRVRFLLSGKDENLTQTLRTQAFDDFYLGDGDGQAVLRAWTPGQRPELVWKVEPGLSDPSCHSFASTTRPNHFLRIVNNRISVDPTDGSRAFAATVTWCARRINSGIGFHNAQGRVDLAVNAPAGVGDVWHVEAPQPPLPIERRYNADAAARGRLGTATGAALINDNGTGYRPYQNGRLYQAFRPGSNELTTSVVAGEILSKFASSGYENGVLGYPIEDERPLSQTSGRVQRFTSGAVYIVPNVGTFAVHGEIYKKYATTNYENGFLSYPTSDTTRLPDGTGWATTFSGNGGAIYHHPSIGAKIIYGNIRARWNQLGAEKSWLGYPTSDEFDLPKGRRNTFQNGRIDFSNDGGGTFDYKTVAIEPKAIAIKGVGSQSCIQIAGVGQDALRDGAGAELWQCVPGAVKQIWDVVPLGDNKYNLKNRNSGKCLDVYNSNLDNNGLIMQHSCHNGLNQQWELTTDNTGENYALRAVHSAKVADGRGRPPFNGKPVGQWADSGTNSQRWTIIPQ
ncbi:hypothetical protein ALI144C_17500 [Actinosynnema sp. ALI-1.44]|uniref:RICIN domain-containing protein n=1 Tax=Actinosynnema sp. ALI-1.44 TaxID=1933779 RepID=UPI00097BAD26|nr:RICIN domain-containing protein [Actinosynnema sp. ALI-1.44]ONI82862.1 hypothetical protein ALI144C_17500 [Actinosynnema sp. ALI-1.44]